MKKCVLGVPGCVLGFSWERPEELAVLAQRAQPLAGAGAAGVVSGPRLCRFIYEVLGVDSIAYQERDKRCQKGQFNLQNKSFLFYTSLGQ